MTTVARLKIKEIGRNLRKQWRMVFNSIVHAKSYLLKELGLHDCEKFVLWIVKLSLITNEIHIYKNIYIIIWKISWMITNSMILISKGNSCPTNIITILIKIITYWYNFVIILFKSELQVISRLVCYGEYPIDSEQIARHVGKKNRRE